MQGSDNYAYDLVDVMRQAVAEKGRLVYAVMRDAIKADEPALFDTAAERFLSLILLQDELLATRPEFRVGTWIARARKLGVTPEEKDHYEWNARTLITTWGNREAANRGGLRDYAHREWNGILRDFYYKRWKMWVDRTSQALHQGEPLPSIDWYAVEEPWTKETKPYASTAEGDPIEAARRAYRQITTAE